jgi:hypothetical protein
MVHLMEASNVQTGSQDITENSYVTENSNVPDKIEFISCLETVMRKMKNYTLPGYTVA